LRSNRTIAVLDALSTLLRSRPQFAEQAIAKLSE
jgi:hypothetical protein